MIRLFENIPEQVLHRNLYSVELHTFQEVIPLVDCGFYHSYITATPFPSGQGLIHLSLTIQRKTLLTPTHYQQS